MPWPTSTHKSTQCPTNHQRKSRDKSTTGETDQRNCARETPGRANFLAFQSEVPKAIVPGHNTQSEHCLPQQWQEQKYLHV